jgi:hypothetical protein
MLWFEPAPKVKRHRNRLLEQLVLRSNVKNEKPTIGCIT